jgi:hypothetical protein
MRSVLLSWRVRTVAFNNREQRWNVRMIGYKKIDAVVQAPDEYDNCQREANHSINLLRLPPWPHIRPIRSIYPFTLICSISLVRPSMRERPCVVYHSIEPTTVDCILGSPNCISILVLVQPRPLLLSSAIRDYESSLHTLSIH